MAGMTSKGVRIRGQLTIKLRKYALFSKPHQTGQLADLMGARQNLPKLLETRPRGHLDLDDTTSMTPRLRTR